MLNSRCGFLTHSVLTCKSWSGFHWTFGKCNAISTDPLLHIWKKIGTYGEPQGLRRQQFQNSHQLERSTSKKWGRNPESAFQQGCFFPHVHSCHRENYSVDKAGRVHPDMPMKCSLNLLCAEPVASFAGKTDCPCPPRSLRLENYVSFTS